MAASLSSFAIQQRTGVAFEPSYLVVASSPLPICVSSLSSSTTPPSLSFTPASLMSALQEPVPGSAQFSSRSPCPVAPVSPVSIFQLPVPGSVPFSSITSQSQFGVTPVSLVSALQMPVPGSGHSSPPTPKSPLPLSALSVPDLDFSSPPPISSPIVLSPLSTFSQCNSSFSESCSNISVSGLEGVLLSSTPSGMSV